MDNATPPPTLREIVAHLSASATALALLGAVLQARTSNRPLHPALAPRVAAVLRAAGAEAALEAAAPAELAPLLAELRHFWVLDDDFLAAHDRAPGWHYRDEAALDSGGEITRGFPAVLARIAPTLDELEARLAAPTSRFLDVGVGVGQLSIAMARQWPSLHVVGIDPWAPSLARAHAGVAAAGLGDRIELREQAGEDLADSSRYDLAWVPAPFIEEHRLPVVARRVREALVPGGWALFAAARTCDDLRGEAMRFRVALYGGRAWTAAELDALLRDAGFGDVRTLPGPPRDFKMIVAARRMP